jgi:predicted DNA-binding transcriptional regulator AlpA
MIATTQVGELEAFSQAKIAARFGFSKKTWQRMIEAGRAPEPDIDFNRTKRWSKGLIQRWLESQAAAK